MGRKLGVPPLPLWGGQLCHLGWGLSPYQVASWSIQPFGGGELGPRLTQCGQGRGLPACQVSSWSNQPFGHSTPTLQTGQTGQTDKTGQRSDSIGRTALQTVVGCKIYFLDVSSFCTLSPKSPTEAPPKLHWGTSVPQTPPFPMILLPPVIFTTDQRLWHIMSKTFVKFQWGYSQWRYQIQTG